MLATCVAVVVVAMAVQAVEGRSREDSLEEILAIVKEYPLKEHWGEYEMNHDVAGSVPIEYNGQTWICEGRTDTAYRYKDCQKFKIDVKYLDSESGMGIESGERGQAYELVIDHSVKLKLSTSWPGQYEQSPGSFIEVDNHGGYDYGYSYLKYNGKYMCVLSMNDVKSNTPMCYCCDITVYELADEAPDSKKFKNRMKCYNLNVEKECAPAYDSCVVFDPMTLELVQIGGYYGTDVFENILCFDLPTQQYHSSVATVDGLEAEAEGDGEGLCVCACDSSIIIVCV